MGMTNDEVMELARQASKEWFKELPTPWETANQVPKRYLGIFAKLVEERAAAKEREAIADEFWSCVMSDLEHGVKSLNEKASFDFQKNMPDLSKFGRWLNERGEA